MSSATMYFFSGDKAAGSKDYGNSWGGGFFIWNALFERYLKDTSTDPYPNVLTDDRLWELWKDPRLSDCEKAVLLGTCDYAMVDKENYQRYAKDLRDFVQRHPVPTGVVCHLPEWADDVEACEYDCIGFRQTSVMESLWESWDEEKDEPVPYDFSTGEKHYEIYKNALDA